MKPHQIPSKADFEAWKEAPWFISYLEDRITSADRKTNECAKTILICPSEHIETFRMRAAVLAGCVSELETLQNLTHEDLVDEMAEADDGGA